MYKNQTNRYSSKIKTKYKELERKEIKRRRKTKNQTFQMKRIQVVERKEKKKKKLFDVEEQTK